MKKAGAFIFSLLLLICFSFNSTLACTTFCLKNKGEVLFGKNYDWMIGDGMLFVNKRGVSKTSALEDEKNLAKWVSKYGSVTFNQYGWESPSGGMNEAGLVIELMWLDDTQYPKADDRPAIDVLEWIQYNLDTAATADEVIKNSETVRIASPIKLHYLVNDKNGNSATIEFLDGKLAAHTGEKLPFAALANDTYKKSLEYSQKMTMTAGEGSLDRFSRAASKTKEFEMRQPKTEKEAIDYAFGILSNVAQTNSTQWSIVYDQKRGRIYFRTKQMPQIKSVDIKTFDYECGSEVKILDMNSKESGDVASLFKEYTRAANRDLIERSFNGTPFLKDVPATVKDGYASYPEKFTCGVQDLKKVPDTTKSKAAPTGNAYLYVAFPLYYIYKQLVSS